MPITQEERKELLTYDNGKPIIITKNDRSETCEEYSLLVFVRTTASSTPEYVRSVSLRLLFPVDYPAESPSVFVRHGRLFHPNFTDDGQWVGSKIEDHESLSEYLMRLVRVLQYKEIDRNSIANRNAMVWYNKNKDSGLFPTDHINYSIKPRISIYRINEHAQTQPK